MTGQAAMRGEAPDVSIIVAAWRAEDSITASIRSALAQTGVTLELILVDDASPDDTLGVAKAAAMGDPRFICDRLDRNAGPSGARNRALDLASGRYVCVLDADDAMEPGRLAHMLALAEAQALDIVVDNLVRVAPDETGRLDGPGTRFLGGPRSKQAGPVTLADYMDPVANKAFGGGLGFLKPLIRRERLEQGGVRYDVSLRNSEDYFLIAHLLAKGASMMFTPLAGYRYTIRDGSLSHRLTPELIARIVDAEERFQATYATRFDRAEQQAARRRLNGLRNSRDFEFVVAQAKARRLSGLASAMLRAGPSLPHIGRRFGEIALAKLLGRPDPASR